MATLFLAVAALVLQDEAALRDAFVKEIKAKEAAKRVDAVKKLSGSKEEKTIDLLVKSLKDPALEVRKATAETLEACVDGGGKAIKPLGEILIDKKDDLELRFACAKALGKARYKAEPFHYFLKTMSSIERTEKEFHAFGADVTGVLDKFIGKSYGVDKTTVERWEEWWIDNKDAVTKADEQTRKEWKEKKP
jgi:hypothetical protein